MPVERTGSPVAFWGTETETLNGVTTVTPVASVASTASRAANVARWNNDILIYVKTTEAASTFQVQVAHHGVLTLEGDEPNEANPPPTASWYPLVHLFGNCLITTNSSGLGTLMIPDFEPMWVRLLAGGTYTNVTAGYEIIGS